MIEGDFCCQRFAEAYDSGGVGYEDGWNISGCCGGGCNVMTDMAFCPFCGNELPADGYVGDLEGDDE